MMCDENQFIIVGFMKAYVLRQQALISSNDDLLALVALILICMGSCLVDNLIIF